LYAQELLGQTPCYSILPNTLSVPDVVSQQILSLSSQIASTASTPNPTVSVHIITDQIFALSLPLKNGKELTKSPSTLSLGEKIGIGVGAGLGAIFLIILAVWLFYFVRRSKRPSDDTTVSGQSESTVANWAAQAHKSSASTATFPVSASGHTPKLGHLSLDSYPDQHRYQSNSQQFLNPQQQMRMPPQRRPQQDMMMQGDSPYGQGPIGYSVGQLSELPTAFTPPVEAGGRPLQSWNSGAGTTLYDSSSPGAHPSYGQPPMPPQPRNMHEMGGGTPRPPGW
jgi:hypothetical protein